MGAIDIFAGVGIVAVVAALIVTVMYLCMALCRVNRHEELLEFLEEHRLKLKDEDRANHQRIIDLRVRLERLETFGPKGRVKK